MPPTPRTSARGRAGAASGARRSGGGAAIPINRAPVLTLWAAVVAERLGFDRDAAVTLGKVLAGLDAQSKARRLGLAGPGPPEAFERRRAAERAAGAQEVLLMDRRIPVTETRDGLRAMSDGRPVDPGSAHRYLESKFGDHLDVARAAMEALAHALPKAELEERAFRLYETFRPTIPAGTRGWGAKGVLDPGLIRSLAGRQRGR